MDQTVASTINRAAGGRPIPGNEVGLLIDGPEAYGAMLNVIAGATAWIHFENYIIHSDPVGWRFAEALVEKARCGVHTRVLFDGLGSVATRTKYWRYLRDAGVEVRAFHPLQALDLVSNLARNHRKLVVADGARAVVGGLCIGREWTGEGQKGGRPWRDTAVVIEGPAAAVLDQAFARTWELAGGRIPDGDVPGQVALRGEAEVRVIQGEPGKERAYRVIELLAGGSSSRVWITDAYFVAPPRLLQALRDAAQDGVDVRLLVPGSSDVPFVRNLTRIGYRHLLRSGVRIFEWGGPMLHAKTLVADGHWVRIGSSNLNTSSLVGNYELDVLIADSGLAEAMERQFRADIARSSEILRRPVRAPHRISAALPPALTREDPEIAPAAHRPGPAERRRRAARALRAVLNNARRSIFVPFTILFIGLGLLFFVLPTFTAYVFGGLCAWLAVSAWREAFRRRADQ